MSRQAYNYVVELIVMSVCKELPNGIVYVYHVTYPDRVDAILREGILPQPSKNREIKDAFTDKFAVKGFRRINSVYAYPDIASACEQRGFLPSPNAVIIKGIVNPRRVFVANLVVYANTASALLDGDLERAERLVRRYWGEGMLLEEYLKLDPTDPIRTDPLEAIIPRGIQAELLQVLT